MTANRIAAYNHLFELLNIDRCATQADNDRRTAMENAIENLFQHRIIGGKSVYIVDDHHKALAAWTLERRRLGAAPTLITIDHHTDTDEAFRKFAFLATDGVGDEEAIQLIEREHLANVDWRDDASIVEAIENLAHDEHIHAATAAGILARSFSIQLSDGSGSTQGEVRSDGLYVVPHRCAVDCIKAVYDDDCVKHHADEIIESRYLENQLSRADGLAASIGASPAVTAPFILDIDLDCFHSWRAVSPSDPSTFLSLIRAAEAVTIATEEGCVRELWLDETGAPDVPELLRKLLAHIENALS